MVALGVPEVGHWAASPVGDLRVVECSEVVWVVVQVVEDSLALAAIQAVQEAEDHIHLVALAGAAAMVVVVMAAATVTVAEAAAGMAVAARGVGSEVVMAAVAAVATVA